MTLPTVRDGPVQAEQEARAHEALALTSDYGGVAAASSSLGPFFSFSFFFVLVPGSPPIKSVRKKAVLLPPEGSAW